MTWGKTADEVRREELRRLADRIERLRCDRSIQRDRDSVVSQLRDLARLPQGTNDAEVAVREE